MMSKWAGLLSLLILGTSAKHLTAQVVRPITQGRIECERRVNKFALIRQSFGTGTTNAERDEFERYKSSHPQFLIQRSRLNFSKDSTFFKPSDENDQLQNTFYGRPISEQHNEVFNDFKRSLIVIQKKIFGNTYLITDSTRNITWKLTSETREIAGYVCRRANGILLDSIYVVAFYTEKIAGQGGPESFSGLPGMILGVVLPHDHITWFATRVVEDFGVLSDLKMPTNGKSVNCEGFGNLLKELAANSVALKPKLRELLL